MKRYGDAAVQTVNCTRRSGSHHAQNPYAECSDGVKTWLHTTQPCVPTRTTEGIWKIMCRKLKVFGYAWKLQYMHHLSTMKFKFKNFYKPKLALPCAISGFRRDAHDICALLICYTACSGTSLPTFRDNLSVPSSSSQEIQKESGSFLNFWSLKWDR